MSSNLNVLRDPIALLAENPDWLRVSLSGYTQAVYEIGHREGNIEDVKQNMRHLAEARTATSARTRLQVYYHRYLYNVAEIAPMQKFATSLGFEFDTCLAQFFPVEKIIDYSEGRVTPEDQKILASFRFAARPRLGCYLAGAKITKLFAAR